MQSTSYAFFLKRPALSVEPAETGGIDVKRNRSSDC